MNHKQWLDNEYKLWVEALQASTVHNFGSHPQVKRMLSEVDGWDWINGVALDTEEANVFHKIYSLGGNFWGICSRMAWYAQRILKLNPTSIIEIGGGVGQFFAILRALGYKGHYVIYDLPEVKDFQSKYLDEASKLTGINVIQSAPAEIDLCVSFYAFGEFDDELKLCYIENPIKKCKRGYMAFNPHSGASDDLSIFPFPVKSEPGREENIKIVTW